MQSKLFRTLSLLTGACQQQCFALIACACGCSQKIYSPCIMISVILNSPNNESACSSHRAQNSLAESHLRCCILLCSGLWVFFLPFLIYFSLLSFLSPSLLLSFHIYSIGIRMMIPLLQNTASRGSPMKFERQSWCMYQRRTSQKLRMCMATFPTLIFHHLR